MGGAVLQGLVRGSIAAYGAYMTWRTGNETLKAYQQGHQDQQSQMAPPPANGNDEADKGAEKLPDAPAATAGQCCPPNQDPNKKKDESKEEEKERHRRELGTDPKTGKFSEAEADNGERLEQQLGKTLSRSDHPGADFVDAEGNTYDAMGPVDPKYFNEQQFNDSLGRHLLKSNDTTSVDLTGLNPAQQASVDNYLNGLSAGQRGKVIIVGR